MSQDWGVRAFDVCVGEYTTVPYRNSVLGDGARESILKRSHSSIPYSSSMALRPDPGRRWGGRFLFHFFGAAGRLSSCDGAVMREAWPGLAANSYLALGPSNLGVGWPRVPSVSGRLPACGWFAAGQRGVQHADARSRTRARTVPPLGDTVCVMTEKVMQGSRGSSGGPGLPAVWGARKGQG